MPRSATVILMGVYLILLWLLFDFLYSTFFFQAQALPGRPNPFYDHDLAPNVEGKHLWGEYHYELRTNSLGFKDGRVRDVVTKPTWHRLLLIGDSFTEGIGLPFEHTFAGLLYDKGQNLVPKVEVLNAAVASYSPTLYYRKIKYLLEQGLQFDELVVLPDLSDVYDEATEYFCFDDDPRYRSHCRGAPLGSAHPQHVRKCRFVQCSFIMTDTLRVLIKFKLQQWSRNSERSALELSPRAGWTMPNYRPGTDFAPLGIEGGIARATQNMHKLATLLAERNIRLSVAVYPWPQTLALDSRDSRQVAIWKQFCEIEKCKAFIDLFPLFFAEKEAHADWYRRYYIYGDFHFNAAGQRLIFQGLADRLF